MQWQPGVATEVEPGVRVVLAPNPSPMTHWGTNTWIVGRGAVAVIDPGPDDPGHLAAILGALAPGEQITHICVTHAHKDHAPLARPLSQATGAPVLAFGGALTGLSPRMAGLAGLEGGEGLDHRFAPDLPLQDGARLQGPGWTLEAIHTPGHLGGHLCFAWEDRLFSGDHVMGWAPSLVSPPEGDMTDYMASLHRLAARRWRRGFSGHGAPLEDPGARIAELVAHRHMREAAILAALASGAETLPELLSQVYTGLSPALSGAAKRNILAHLIDLAGRNLVTATPTPGPDARFSRL